MEQNQKEAEKKNEIDIKEKKKEEKKGRGKLKKQGVNGSIMQRMIMLTGVDLEKLLLFVIRIMNLYQN